MGRCHDPIAAVGFDIEPDAKLVVAAANTAGVLEETMAPARYGF
jgi:hypothetical protein